MNCAHCGKELTEFGWATVGKDSKVCHTSTLPPWDDPLDCYRLVTIYGVTLGDRENKIQKIV